MEEGIRVMGVWPVACAARYAPDRVIPGRELCDLLGAGAHFGAGVAVFVTATWFSRESGKCVVQNDIVGVHRDHFGVRNNGMPLVFVGAVNGRGQGDVRFGPASSGLEAAPRLGRVGGRPYFVGVVLHVTMVGTDGVRACMDVRQLEYFLAIVDRGGFNRAASALYVSQPSLSQAVRALERDLGSELFHRIGRRAVLSEAGRALIEPAREAVRSLETARASVAAVHELREGRLDVAAMPSQAVEPLTSLVSAFSRRYPGVSVAINAAFTSRDVIDMVRTGAVELGLLASAGPVSGKEVVCHALGRQRFVLVVPADGPFAGRTAVDCRELAGQRLIVGQSGTGMRAYVDALREQGIDFAVAVETEHRVSLMPLVLAGVGLAVVTDSWRDLAGRLGARVLDIEPENTLDIALVARRGILSPAAAAFVTAAASAPGR